MLKVYVCKTRKVLSYPIVMKSGVIRTIKFTGGEPPRIFSIFQTDDVELQKEIEKNPGYGKIFELQKGQNLKQSSHPKRSFKIGNTIVSELNPKKDNKETKENNEKYIVGNEVTSGQKAKKFLLDLKALEGKLTGKMLINNNKIIETAKSFNVAFPNWPQFNE